MVVALGELSLHDLTPHTFTVVLPLLPPTPAPQSVLLQPTLNIGTAPRRERAILTDGGHGAVLEIQNLAPVYPLGLNVFLNVNYTCKVT